MADKHSYGSLDYKVINKNIKQILDARSQLDNTVQVAMPFIKATTTIGNNKFLGAGCMGFTVGLHGINEDVQYEDIYSSQDGTSPLVGYTYTQNNKAKRIYAIKPEDLVQEDPNKIIDNYFDLFSQRYRLTTHPEDSKFVRIPPPGITSATIGRNRNGYAFIAELQISVPSLIQLESLHRFFLIPSMGIVLEWGQQFAPYDSTNPIINRQLLLGSDKLIEVDNQAYSQLSDISNYTFPWYKRDKLTAMLDRLARRQVGFQDIYQEYVYPTNGQYMWTFGHIGNFGVKSNSDGSFNVNVKIYGTAEDHQAFSVRETVIPAKSPDAEYFCGTDTTSIYSYFANTATGLNFKTLLDDILSGKNKKLSDWKSHIIKFDQGNQKDGDPKPSTETPVTEQKNFGDAQDAYFITWRFFVNVVVNDVDFGIKAIFKNANMSLDKLSTIGLLLPYADGENRENTNIAKLPSIDDPRESYVGMNQYLRSTNPSVLIIVNEKAATLAEANPQYSIQSNKEQLLSANGSADFRVPTVTFDNSAKKADPDSTDKGFLSSGVWLNHKAIVESMLSSNTFLNGIVKLLEGMNTATNNYWELTLDYIEGDEKFPHPNSYMVIDANYRENSENAVNKFIEEVHIFNKHVRYGTDGKLVGSELIEASVDLALPKRLFSQISTLGLLSQEQLNGLFKKQQRVGDVIDPQKEAEQAEGENFGMKISDPNNSFATMFGLVSVAPIDGVSPDLTKIPNEDTDSKSSVCGKSNTQTPAATGGQGHQVSGISLTEAAVNTPDARKKQFDDAKKVVDSDICKKCEPCNTPVTTLATAPSNVPGVVPVDRAKYTYLDFSVSGLTLIGYDKLLEAVSNSIREAGGGNWKGVVTSLARPDNHRSRHGQGFAIDIGAIYIRDKLYSVKGSTSNEDLSSGDAKVAAEAFDEIARILQVNYQFKLNGAESIDSKNIFWRKNVASASANGALVNHFNHIHISWLPENTELTEAPSQEPPKTNVCTDDVYKSIGNGNVDTGKSECEKCIRAKQQVEQTVTSAEASVQIALRNFSGVQRAFRYVEIFPELMVASIAADSNDSKSNAFGAAPASLSITADLVMPGISGFRMGELFWVDRIPAFYKVFGAFQILGIEDKIDVSGWKTNIHSRFNYLGTKWRSAMVKRLNSPTT